MVYLQLLSLGYRYKDENVATLEEIHAEFARRKLMIEEENEQKRLQREAERN